MNILDPTEIPKAFGYTAIGAVVVKAFDLFIRWHSGQRRSAMEEVTEALRIGAETRAELRKEIEEMRRDKVAAEERAETAQTELRSAKRQLSTEQRAVRHRDDEK